MQRAVSSLPLSGAWLAKLASCGFESADDLREVGVVELSRGIYVMYIHVKTASTTYSVNFFASLQKLV